MEEGGGEARLDEDWAIVEGLLPEGWQAQARECGALRRGRGIADARTLLRVMLVHLAQGCSLRETAVRAAQGGLAQVSDVALRKRLRNCGAWFQWLGAELMRRWVALQPRQVFGAYRVRVVDGSVVREPGATGSSWRLHYAIDLSTLRCDEVILTEPTMGESPQRFAVCRGDPPARLCAVRKSATAAAAARYTFVPTTLDERVPLAAILEMCRGRWQIELAFKRLKSSLDLGHPRKTDPVAAQT